MNKNSMAFIASVVLLFAAYSYLSKTSAGPSDATPSDSNSTESNAKQPSTAAQNTGPEPTALPVVADFNPDLGPGQAQLATAHMKVDVGSKGGCIEDVVLPRYTVSPSSSEPVKLIEKLEPCRALGIKIGALDFREERSYLTQQSPSTVTIEQRKDGLHLRRILTLDEGGYRGKLTVELHNVRNAPAEGLLELELGATSAKEGSSSLLGFDQSQLRYLAYYADDKRHESLLTFEETPAAEVLELVPDTKISWAAAGGTYFMFALSPLFQDPIGLRFERQPFNMQPSRQSPPERTIYEGWLQHRYTIEPSRHTSWNYDLYLGPLDLDDLKKAGHNLDEAINYGFFKIVAWPMFKLLKAIEGLVGNWGAAIVVLTLLIRLLFFPLTAKSYTASKKMQKIQPLLNELREKFKDDKAKQQQELMALMSREGVNPLGGCLPVLPQIPVFFGLNAVLMHTFELRQAPLGLWIRDLSTHDPYYVSPIIMAVLMYVQQRMIPMPGMDPTQAKIMRFLPIVFALFMITYPSGLVVYIITSTLFSIVQQQVMMKTFKEA